MIAEPVKADMMRVTDTRLDVYGEILISDLEHKLQRMTRTLISADPPQGLFIAEWRKT